jgi:ABC-type antimicrobial peptide transport system permease subunit
MMKKLKNRASNTSEWIRKGLVIFQFAASFVLICMTIAIVLQIRHGQHRPLGYTKNHLLRVSGVSGITPQSLIRDELAKSALVEGTAFANDPLVFLGSQSNAFQWQRKSDEIDPYINRSYVSHDYIATIGFKLLEGRTFYEGSEMESRNVIINKTLADMMGDEGRINSELWQGNRERAIIYTVVGIIDDYICDDIYRSKSEPLILHYDNGRPGGFLYIRLNSQADIGKAFIMVQRTLSQFSTDRPLDYAFVDDLVNRMFDVQRQNGFLVAFFSVLSIFISCLGLFGLVTYVAESKIKELGIRKILGAGVGSLVGMLVKDFLILVTISAFVATPLAYYWIDKMLQDYEYRITIGLGLFALAMLITILLTIFTVGWQAGKAATANPVNALKVE